MPNDNEPENLPELKEETIVEEDNKNEDEGWLARIVPEIPDTGHPCVFHDALEIDPNRAENAQMGPNRSK